MIKNSYIEKIINKIKRGIEYEIKKKNYDYALELISNCANLIYQTNFSYVDEFLENALKQIAYQLNVSFTSESNDNKVIFYDGFGLNERGIAQIYLKALCQLQEVVYITYEDRKDEIPDILSLVKSYNGKVCYINRKNNKFVNQIFQFVNIISIENPGRLMFYTFPNDVVGVVLLNLVNNNAIRYQINLTDHAFWLGADSIDKCIEFRDYGATISKKYRRIPIESIVKIPFYPIVNIDMKFQGFPFKKKDYQKVFFSGGALYKTFGDDNRFYRIVSNILNQYNDLIFWYAGSGDDSELKKLINKYPNRVFYTSERKDLFQILEHCRFYLSTYPISGGLMYQYAAIAGIVPVSLKYDDDADGYLKNQEGLNVTFTSEIELFHEINKLMTDETYFYNRRQQMKKSVVTEQEFLKYVEKLLLDENILTIDFIDINTDNFKKEYLERINRVDIYSYLINKETVISSFIHIPFFTLMAIIYRILVKLKFLETR